MKSLYNIILSVFFSSFAFSQNFENKTYVCENMQTAKQLFKCLLEHHPRVSAQLEELKSSEFGIELGSQRPNPSINAQTIAGTRYGQNVAETSVQYVHTFELGGKRAARIERAEAERDLVKADFFSTTAGLNLEIASRLYQLQQNEREITLVDETILTFKKILKTYSSRPALSPEQKVSKNVFEFALKDYENRKNNLLITQAELQTYFNALSLVSFSKVLELSKNLRFDIKKTEQKFADILKNKKSNSFDIQLVDAQLKIAQAELATQKAATWGDLEVGPTYQYRYEEANGYPLVGVGISLPLPLYNQNSGGKEKAFTNVKSLEYMKNFQTRKIQEEWDSIEHVFRQTIENMKGQPSRSEMEQKHNELEGLFYRGLVSSSLIVEAHRQMMDLTLSQHQQKLKSLELLSRAFVLSGEVPKDFL